MAGGEGTRLRPLTSNQPKPMLPLANRPMMEHIVRLLKEHGFDEIVVTLAFLPQAIRTYFGDGSEFGVRMVYATEETPLGTAGSVLNARQELTERFLVISGDVLTDFDLSAELAQHEAKGALATLALIAVPDTTAYGVVPTRDDLQVDAFLEKTTSPPTNRINAGAYVLEREVVDRIPAGRAVSFEHEVFPQLVGEGLYGYLAEGYWIDIGTPDRYLEATYDLLAERVESTLPARDETGSLVAEGSITSGARIIGPMSVLGRHCSVGVGSTVERSVLHDDVRVGVGCTITGAVVAQGARIEDDVVVEEGAVVGAGASVSAGSRVERGARIDPGAAVSGGQPVGPA